MVIVPGTMLADPSKDTPPMVRAVSNVVAVSAFPVNAPTKDVAVSAPVLELYVRDVDDFGPKSPVAAVANKTLHAVSVASLAMVIVSAFPVNAPTKEGYLGYFVK